MVIDQVVNYIIDELGQKLWQGSLILKEKSVAENKIKIKLEGFGGKFQVEIDNYKIAELIYNGFLESYDRERITLNEFRSYIDDTIENESIKFNSMDHFKNHMETHMIELSKTKLW